MKHAIVRDFPAHMEHVWNRSSNTQVARMPRTRYARGRLARAGGVGDVGANWPVLFPNPAYDQVVVGGCTGARLLVSDALGRMIWQGRVGSGRGVLEVGAWARGTYVLRLEWDGRTEVFKFVLAE